MHRRHLIQLLDRYLAMWPAEVEIARRFAAFSNAHADCLLRTCVPGHITASTWILAAEGERALLTHHRKLGRWLQLGGHVDGEPRIELAALREAQEESGMTEFRFFTTAAGDLVPLDLDVHAIPARGSEPWHEHWDVRFLIRAAPGQDLVMSPESTDLRWFEEAELAVVTNEESVLRLHRKAVEVQGFGRFDRLIWPD